MNQQNLHFSQGGEGSICNNVDMVGPGPKSKGRPNPDNLNLQRKSNKKNCNMERTHNAPMFQDTASYY